MRLGHCRMNSPNNKRTIRMMGITCPNSNVASGYPRKSLRKQIQFSKEKTSTLRTKNNKNTRPCFKERNSELENMKIVL